MCSAEAAPTTRRGASPPNGATPLPDGGVLVTEIGGWIDRLAAGGRLLWSARSPVAYPSDAQLLPNGRVLVASFTDPGRIVIMDTRGNVTWSFGPRAGRTACEALARGALAERPDRRERRLQPPDHRDRPANEADRLAVRPHGRVRHGGRLLNKPDGLDLLPAAGKAPAAKPKPQPKPAPKLQALVARRVGSLPQAASRVAAVALPNGRILALGGLVAGSSSDQVLLGPPAHLRAAGHLPTRPMTRPPRWPARARTSSAAARPSRAPRSSASTQRLGPQGPRATSGSRSPTSAPPTSAAAPTSSAATRARASRPPCSASVPAVPRHWSRGFRRGCATPASPRSAGRSTWPAG